LCTSETLEGQNVEGANKIEEKMKKEGKKQTHTKERRKIYRKTNKDRKTEKSKNK
jgi:hypothetical protein